MTTGRARAQRAKRRNPCVILPKARLPQGPSLDSAASAMVGTALIMADGRSGHWKTGRSGEMNGDAGEHVTTGAPRSLGLGGRVPRAPDVVHSGYGVRAG